MAPDEGSTGPARHWNHAYASRGVEGVSWHEPMPRVSLGLIDRLGTRPDAAVLDVGGGASHLADELVHRGFSDVTVLDVSTKALAEVQGRLLGAHALHVVLADVLKWRPARTYDLWHDRALFHFLVDEGDRRRYLETLRTSAAPHAGVILGTFAPDAPEQCSGLPVARYSAADLVELLGPTFEPSEVRRDEHVTPGGTIQPFTWIAGRLASTSAPRRVRVHE